MTLQPLLIAGTIVLSSALVSLQADQRGANPDAARIIETTRGVSIESQLRPDDRLVLLKRGGVLCSLVSDGVGTLEDDLRYHSSVADVIAIVSPQRTDSFLAQDGEWITTRVTMTVDELIRERGSSKVASSHELSFEHSGGEFQFGPTTVRAPGYYTFRPDDRYLLFLVYRGGRYGTVGLPFKIAGEQLAPVDMDSGQPAPSPLYGQPVSEIAAELRRRILLLK